MLLGAGPEVDPRSAGQFMTAYPHRPILPAVVRSFSRPLAAALCLIGLVVNCAIVGPPALHTAFQGQNDFRQFYIGAKLAGSGSFYNKTRTEEAQREAFGYSNEHLTPVRLPFYYSL